MATVDPRFLTLLGHELRAPAGVVGGYLALLERDASLTPAQRRAVEGARQAQRVIVDILDDARRLADGATPAAAHGPAVRLAAVTEALAVLASSASIGVTIAEPLPPAAVEGPADVLASALFAVARAVTREHGADVVCSAAVEERHPRAILLRMCPAETAADASADRVDFQALRSGLGLALLVAQARIERLGGTLHDLRRGDARAGVEITLPVHGADV